MHVRACQSIRNEARLRAWAPRCNPVREALQKGSDLHAIDKAFHRHATPAAAFGAAQETWSASGWYRPLSAGQLQGRGAKAPRTKECIETYCEKPIVISLPVRKHPARKSA